MILRYDLWQRIREHFSEEDKAEIRAAISGEAICPRGWVVDTDKLAPGLLELLKKR